MMLNLQCSVPGCFRVVEIPSRWGLEQTKDLMCKECYAGRDWLLNRDPNIKAKIDGFEATMKDQAFKE